MTKTKDSDLFKLSVSKVKTFLTCKAKYRFSYIEHLPKREWDFQIFGKFLHKALEDFHSSIIKGFSGPDHVLMKQSFSSALQKWGAKLTPAQRVESIDILKEYLAIRFKERECNSVPKVIRIEKDFSLNINDSVLLNGFIDVIQLDPDGVLHVADYKTSKDKRYLKKDLLQLKTYAYVVMIEDASIKNIRCSYVMLRHKFDRIEKEFNREEIIKTAQDFLDYSEKINAEKLYRPSTSPLCKYCDYLGQCDAGKKYMIGGSDSFGITDW